MKNYLTPLKKVFFMIAGTLFFILGLIGLVVRLLPTTPLLLLSSWCYIRSSKKLHQYLIESPLYQKYMKGFLEKGGFSLKTKILIIGWVWVLILFIVFSTSNPTIMGLALILGIIKTLFFLFIIKTVS